jgi:hypothetical protein
LLSDDNLLDLVECSNEEGPGPINSSKRFQGLPTLIMRREHEVSCDPSQERQVIRDWVHKPPPLSPPPPPLGRLGRDPLPPSTGLPPPQTAHLGPGSVETSLRPPSLDQRSRF